MNIRAMTSWFFTLFSGYAQLAGCAFYTISFSFVVYVRFESSEEHISISQGKCAIAIRKTIFISCSVGKKFQHKKYEEKLEKDEKYNI